MPMKFKTDDDRREWYREYTRTWRANNAEKIMAQRRAKPGYAEQMRLNQKAYRVRHKDRLRDERLKKYADNPEPFRAAARRYICNNRGKVSALNAEYRAAKRDARVEWADGFIISEMYDLAALRSKLTGVAWHVDHIVPLQSKLVCGLHADCNLRVIPGKENISKGNSSWPDMP